MKLLEGKNAIVTGGGRGIGKAAALMLAQNGANVAVVSRTKDELDAVVNEIEAYGVYGLAIVADIGIESASADVASTFLSRFDRCDILVNDAGMSHYTTVAEWPVEEVKKLFNLNILGTYLMCKEFGPRMVEQGSGKIIMVSSVMGTVFFGPKHVAYCASKAAIAAMGRAMQAEFGKSIQVNTVLPGLIRTRLVLDMEPFGYPVHDPMEPEAIAPAFVFLASELSNRYFGKVINLTETLQLMDKVRAEFVTNGPSDLKELIKTMKLTPELRDAFKDSKELVDYWLNLNKSE